MLFSIITINYNNASGLKKTLESVKKQKFVSFEHVIIDGLSSDGSLKVINDCIYDKLHYVSEVDFGISDAFNKGIIQSKGEYILMLNSGDVFYDEYVLDIVSKKLNELVIRPDVLWGKVISETGFFVGEYKKNKINPDSIPHQGAFVRRDIYLNETKYNMSYKIRMDYQFFSDLLNKKCTFKFMDEIISIYEMNGISMRNKKIFYLEGAIIDLKYFNVNFFGNTIRYFYHAIKGIGVK